MGERPRGSSKEGIMGEFGGQLTCYFLCRGREELEQDRRRAREILANLDEPAKAWELAEWTEEQRQKAVEKFEQETDVEAWEELWQP